VGAPKGSTQTKRSLRLNGYQRDVMLGVMKAEVTRIQAENSVPRSLKLLAIKELSMIVEQLEQLPGMNGDGS